MVRLKLRRKQARKSKGEVSLGFKEIRLLFNVGPFPGGGDCLIVDADGKRTTINSNDLIADIEAYKILAK